jgi:hypothetical protein
MPQLFKQSDIERISAAVGLSENTPQNRKTSNRAPSPIHQSGDLVTVRVTSLTTTGGRYPGKLLQFNPITTTYTDLIDVWIKEINSGTLAIQRYSARRNGTADGTDATKPVFEVELGGGGGTITVKDSTGSPICTGINTLVIDDATMSVVCNGDGSATIAVKTTSVTVATGVESVVCNDDGTISVTLTTTTVNVVA